ncbi:MFS transporter [Archangium lansingense]|uniref:MFS transporter n=1 Tax=Archangium lansingense TaxID=2995310 RepID=A0ABT4AAU5_9BACT|nr:MFS transporter [Archangium lansinium]MCY1078745.1 MFS transporter [Archangium lansinium]
MLLLRHRAFRSLWTARAISFAGDALSLVALMLHVANTTGQALAVSLLLLVGDFAPALLSPLTGAISDRFDLKRVMITCELIQGALLVLIALTMPPLPLLLALVAARAVAGQVFQPASRAAVPALVPSDDLEAANSTLGFGTNGAEALGPLIAAALLPLVGIRGVLLVDAASFFVSAVILATLPSLPSASAGQENPPSLLHDAKIGLGYILSTPAVRVIALGFFAVVAFNGVDDVALVVLAKDTLRAGDSAVGLLLGAVGIGLLVGYVLLAHQGSRASMVALLLLGFAVSSVGNLFTGLAWAVSAAFAMQTVRGVGLAAMDVATNTLLQRLVPPELLGRVFGNLYGAIGVAAALSYVGGGLLLDATSAPVTLFIAGAGGTVATLVTAFALPAALRKNTEAQRPS